MMSESVAALWCELALMDIRLKLLPYSLNRKLLQADSPDKGANGDTDRNDEIIRLSRLVEKAAKHSFPFNMSCLRQALVIRSKLRAMGIGASLVYGARKGPSGFSAHAWIKAGGLTINGAPDEVFQQFNRDLPQ